MSTYYFYVKENPRELIELTTRSETYEELLNKIKSYQKAELSIAEVQEKLFTWLLDEFDITDEYDPFFLFLLKRFVPSLMTWVTPDTKIVDEYTLYDSVEKEVTKEQLDDVFKRGEYSFTLLYKTVGSIDEIECPNDGIIDIRTSFNQALTEMRKGLRVYLKDKPDEMYQIKDNVLYKNDEKIDTISTKDILSYNWFIERK